MRSLKYKDIKFCNRAAKIGALHSKLGYELFKKYYNSGLTSMDEGDYMLLKSRYADILKSKENTYENESERG